VTGAGKAAWGVGTVSVGITVMKTTVRTFIDIHTRSAVTLPAFVARVSYHHFCYKTITSPTAISVDTVRIHITVICPKITLIDVLAIVAPDGVHALVTSGAVMGEIEVFSGALVDVTAGKAISLISCIASAFIVPSGILA
jgi:hypothetical protein